MYEQLNKLPPVGTFSNKEHTFLNWLHLTFLQNLSDHPTRISSSCMICIPTIRNGFDRRSSSFRAAPAIWNCLPQHIRSSVLVPGTALVNRHRQPLRFKPLPITWCIPTREAVFDLYVSLTVMFTMLGVRTRVGTFYISIMEGIGEWENSKLGEFKTKFVNW